MYLFKVAVVGQNWKRAEEVVASSLEEASAKLHQAMWWDTYSPHEYELSFIGKSRLS